MKQQKVELLAPAGNYDCFLAAIQAGADAVYLAGNRFGARAYAENFTTQQLIEAISHAHLYGRKLYLTVNTLLKPDETGTLVEYILPYYEAGLDGVIVQDLGVFEILKKHFPDLELHCSTQMTLTGVDGAAFAEKIGASRIVPARELCLDEIRAIHKAHPALELECFIHGALCYCYSGQCLFSSLIGGRSGNRGTCAQPCRLPYDVRLSAGENAHQKPKEIPGKYPLSLKDLSTIHMIPELIEAGIYSFKIEGRMKSADYVAGVTGIYRAVIDRYLADEAHDTGPTAKELTTLSGLYVRSETEEGYYHHYNGKHMITPDKPSYSGCGEETLAYIREQYRKELPEIPVSFEGIFQTEKPAALTASCPSASVTVTGEPVSAALKKPLSQEDIQKQLQKTGGTIFSVSEITLQADDHIFLPVSKLNELRRTALEALQNKLLEDSLRKYVLPKETDKEAHAQETERTHEKHPQKESAVCYTAFVRTKEQLEQCVSHDSLARIYVDSSILLPFLTEFDRKTEKAGYQKETAAQLRQLLAENHQRLYLSFPRIIREKNRSRIQKLAEILCSDGLTEGIYVHSVDGYELASELLTGIGQNPKEHIVLSPFIAVMNPETERFWEDKCDVFTLPVELNEKELRSFEPALSTDSGHMHRVGCEMMVYGRIPFMVTANCIQKSFGTQGCSHISGIHYLKDRKQNIFPVWNDCTSCYNIIYNHVPLSLHRHLDKLTSSKRIESLMLSFTTESADETEEILQYYLHYPEQEWNRSDYTNGHYARGVL